jgi:HEAT repeat protein
MDQLLKEIAKHGWEIDNIFDLVNTKQRYPELIPVLIDGLDNFKEYDKWLFEGLVRSLAVKEAKGLANQKILELYDKVSKTNESLGWALGNTMEIIIEEKDLDQVLKIVGDPDNATSRQMFILGLAKIKNRKTEIEEVLLKIIDDSTVTGHVISTLGKLKSKAAEEIISKFLTSKNSFWRNEAKAAIKRINK